jgi:CspA family cold shock protein
VLFRVAQVVRGWFVAPSLPPASQPTGMEIVCGTCGTTFAFLPHQQARHAARAWQPPKHCLRCREWRRQPALSRGPAPGLLSAGNEKRIQTLHNPTWDEAAGIGPGARGKVRARNNRPAPSSSPTERGMTGTIVKIEVERGFAFVEADDGSGEFFLHKTAMLDRRTFVMLTPGQRVAFEPTTTDRGPRAEAVRTLASS